MRRSTMYPNLLSAIKIRGLELRNRVVYPAMGTKMADDKYVTDQLIAYHLASCFHDGGWTVVAWDGESAPDLG